MKTLIIIFTCIGIICEAFGVAGLISTVIDDIKERREEISYFGPVILLSTGTIIIYLSNLLLK